MLKITVFNLAAVIRYSEEDMLALFASCMAAELNAPVELNPYSKLYSYEAKVRAWFSDHDELELSDALLESIRKQFHKSIKKQFLKDEDAFEVRPGVQSLFSKLEGEKKWMYGITSPFWQENTKFILESCGVFSKTKLTLSSDHGISDLEQIEIIKERGQKKEQEPEIEVVCIGKAGRYKKEGYKVLKPKKSNKESNFHTYPRFQEFFSLKSKKKKSKNKD